MESFFLLEKAEKNYLDGDLDTALHNVYQALEDAALDYVREAGLKSSLEFSGESEAVRAIVAFMDSMEVPQKIKSRWSHLASWAAMSDGELTPDRIIKEFSVKAKEAKAVILEIKTLLDSSRDTA